MAFAVALGAEAVDADAEKLAVLVEDGRAERLGADLAEDPRLGDKGDDFVGHDDRLAVEVLAEAAEDDDVVLHVHGRGVRGVHRGEFDVCGFFGTDEGEIVIGVLEGDFGGEFDGSLGAFDHPAVDGGGDVEGGERHDDEAVLGDDGAEHLQLAFFLLRGVVAGGDFDFHHRAEEQHGVLVGRGKGERLFLERPFVHGGFLKIGKNLVFS